MMFTLHATEPALVSIVLENILDSLGNLFDGSCRWTAVHRPPTLEENNVREETPNLRSRLVDGHHESHLNKYGREKVEAAATTATVAATAAVLSVRFSRKYRKRSRESRRCRVLFRVPNRIKVLHTEKSRLKIPRSEVAGGSDQ